MRHTERERVFLVRGLPDLSTLEPVLIRVGDFHDSNSIDALKIKQKGNRYLLVKKEGDSVEKRSEHQIPIKQGEFEILWPATVQNHEKLRYIIPYGPHSIELDIYKGKLEGYVRAEVEFASEDELKSFIPPPWFGPEITHLNHAIHADLGIVTFEDMEKRFKEKDIVLERLE
ncbi:adenylate cyclase [Candidatus Woesearchaeota archaeon]|nr:adenylate cyclase [Candidatus Woesearchaeota archaeon]